MTIKQNGFANFWKVLVSGVHFDKANSSQYERIYVYKARFDDAECARNTDMLGSGTRTLAIAQCWVVII